MDVGFLTGLLRDARFCDGGARGDARRGFLVVLGGARERGRRLDDRRAADGQESKCSERRSAGAVVEAGFAGAGAAAVGGCTEKNPAAAVRPAGRQAAMSAFKVSLYAALVALVTFTAPVHAQAAQQDVSWNELSAAQQKVLKNFSEQWPQLTPQRRVALAKGAERWINMPPENRAQARQRFARWQGLTPHERKELRSRYREFQNLPRAEQRRIRNAFQRFRDLPPERRQEIQRRWQDLPPAERQRIREQLRRERMNR